MKRETIAECVGGACDGCQLDPHDKNEPDDWPDWIEMTVVQTGQSEGYNLRPGPPKVRGKYRVYFYDHEDMGT